MATAMRLSLKEWLARPDTEPASEFVDGEVHQKPMPNLAHYILAGFLVARLHSYVRRLNLGLVGPELRCVFGPLSGRRGYVPDVAPLSAASACRG
jgi:Uma2 family endonuclease